MDTNERRNDDQFDDRQPEAMASTKMEASHAALERAFIDEFLHGHGHTVRTVERLPSADRERLLRAAAAEATLKLAEIEARAHFVDEIG